MCGRKILIFVLVSILEIDSSNIPSDHRTLLLRSPILRYPSASTALARESSSIVKLKNSPKKFLRQTNPTNDHRYRKQKNHRWLNPVEYKKKLKSIAGSKYPRNRKKYFPIENYHTEDTRNSENSDVPSSYLKPPKTTSMDYHRYYDGSEKSLDDRPKESWYNRTAGSPKNHRPENENAKDNNNDNDRPIYIRDHAPEQRVEATDEKETNDGDASSKETSKDATGASRDRIEFHVHGHAGPETYIFGFDTGDGENRQYRMEERHEDGTVTGHYGYIDARGKLRKVRYKASPTHGYEEKHHEMNEQEA